MSEQVYYHAFMNRDRLINIADPDPATCEALSVLFRLEGFQTVFSLDSSHFLASLERRRPDVVVANLQVGGESGLNLLRRVKSMRTGTPVFIVCDTPQVEAAVAAMKEGASDVITKPFDSEYFLQSVRDALRRDIHLGAMSGGRRPVEVRGFSQLTPREREVLQLITNGQSNKEAGRELGISPRTIEVHRARVMEKLGARNTADLMRIVLTT
ncbi:LuxR C-terminal-related transcriptional regulator [Devosia algicola]|uniref:LuxR C-terminal-related transcriptional regulator n=1 Tax=Devosia algicola TaxID=3026418 RepID=A0ABY7YMY3_9HYPH|nr:LuxR C-terminal-related transcriptional regulator [Devosia algicola]WDR02626.1 LuxR C-terminal-related transcriptional regulator [Devosia algicola]